MHIVLIDIFLEFLNYKNDFMFLYYLILDILKYKDIIILR